MARMKLFALTKLSGKLLTLYLVIIGVTLIGIFSAIETREYFAQRRSLVVDLEELIRTQSVPIATALWELDTGKINAFLEEVGNLPFVQGSVVTDSTADIPQELAEKHNIHIVPAILIIDGQSIEDGKGLTRHEFYERMPSMRTTPTTSTPCRAPGS